MWHKYYIIYIKSSKEYVIVSYGKYTSVIKILLGSNPLIACVLAIRGGGQKPINTSIELVDLFTYTSGGIL